MIEIRNLTKSFKTPDGTVEALRDVSLTVRDGDIAITTILGYSAMSGILGAAGWER